MNGPTKLGAIGLILILFGIASLFTSAMFTNRVGDRVSFDLPPTGGTLGPLAVKEPNRVFLITVEQGLTANGWIYVDGELQDEEGEYLFGFGEELWHESGYDDGPWTEWKTNFDLKVTIPEPGNFLLAFKTQSNPPATRPLRVTVEEKVGSTVPHFAGGLLALVLGFVLHRLGAKQKESEYVPSWDT